MKLKQIFIGVVIVGILLFLAMLAIAHIDRTAKLKELNRKIEKEIAKEYTIDDEASEHGLLDYAINQYFGKNGAYYVVFAAKGQTYKAFIVKRTNWAIEKQDQR